MKNNHLRNHRKIKVSKKVKIQKINRLNQRGFLNNRTNLKEIILEMNHLLKKGLLLMKFILRKNNHKKKDFLKGNYNLDKRKESILIMNVKMS